MSVDPTQAAPVAPAEASDNTAAQGDPAPSPAPVASVAPAAVPAGLSKAERDRRAAEGRRQAELERTVQGLTQTVNALGAQLSASEQRRLDHELSQLDPLERAQAEINLLKERIAGTPSRPTPVAPPRVSPDIVYTQDRSREIVQAINEEFGTTLTGDEAGLDWDSERTFELSARLLAVQQSAAVARGAVTPPAPIRTDAVGDDVPKKSDVSTPETVQEIEARVTAQIRKDLGIASPASPQALSPRASAGVPTEDDLQKTVEGYRSKDGPRATIQKLREQREALAKAANLS